MHIRARKKAWWKTEWFWSGMLGGVVLGALAAVAAYYLNWPVPTQVWLVVTAFLGGAALEWLRVGAQKHAFTVLVVGLGWTGWYLSPDGTFRKVAWLAPVSRSAAAVEEAAPAVAQVELPAAPPSSAAPARAPAPRRAPAPASTGAAEHAEGAVPARYVIEVYNAEPQALQLSYTAGLAPRTLGRIGAGETRRFTIEDPALAAILLSATPVGGGDRITAPVQLRADSAARVTLRR